MQAVLSLWPQYVVCMLPEHTGPSWCDNMFNMPASKVIPQRPALELEVNQQIKAAALWHCAHTHTVNTAKGEKGIERDEEREKEREGESE